MRTILVDPHLPAWLPDIELQGVQVGRATFDLTIQRRRHGRLAIHTQGDHITVLRQPTMAAMRARLGR